MASQNQRPKYDTSRVISLIPSVESYNEIGTKDNESAEKLPNGYKTRQTGVQREEKHENVTVDKKTNAPKKKIVIPKVQNLAENSEAGLSDHALAVLKRKKEKWAEIKAKQGYFRAFLENILPDGGKYDAGAEDLILIKELNGLATSAKDHITNKEFENLIVLWEEATGAEEMLAEEKAVMFAQGLSKNITPHLVTIYNHWGRLREKYKRPLLRKYWKSNYKHDDQSNMKQAFRPIKKERMRLRKNANKSDAELLHKFEVLRKETQKAEALVNMIKHREMIRCYQNEIAIHNFYQHPSLKQLQTIESP